MPTDDFTNEARNFENYNETDRKIFMDKILKKSIALLSILEQERAAIKQRHYLINSNTLESSEQRLAELRSEITQKETELSTISSRETAATPYWTESKAVEIEYVQRDSYAVDIDTYKIGRTFFSYNGNIPISKIELIGGCSFSYLKTFWDTEETLQINMSRTIFLTPLRIMSGLVTFGLSELCEVVLPALMDNYQFTSMYLNGKSTDINKMDWVENITLPPMIEPNHSKFYVSFGGANGRMDCYYRKPTVKLYTLICYMPGHQEIIVSLNNALIALRQQVCTVESDILRYQAALENTETPRDQENLLTDKTLLLTAIESDLGLISEQIAQQQQSITLIVDVINTLRIPVHAKMTDLAQLWAERTANLPALDGLQASATDTVMSSTNNNANNIFSLFHNNPDISIPPSGLQANSSKF